MALNTSLFLLGITVPAPVVAAPVVLDTAWPDMTTNTAPAGYIMSANSEFAGGFEAYRAHDAGGASTRWSAATNALPSWLRVQFPTRRKMETYTFVEVGAASAWTLRGSDDGTNWTDIDIRSGANSSGLFTITDAASKAAYFYYEWRFTAMVVLNTIPSFSGVSATFLAA